MSIRALIAPAAALLALLATAPNLQAQASTTRGFTVGVHASGASLSIEGEERNDAGGLGAIVGYGFNRRFTVFLQADNARFDEQSSGDIEGDWTMTHVDLGVRFSFANSLRRWIPFLQGSFGLRSVDVNDPVVDGNPENNVSLSGTSFTLGGGVDFYLSRAWALEAQLLWSDGEFNTLEVNNVSVSGLDFDASSTRLNLGVRWWP
jgi:opacity protein-like surface antigen